MTKTPHETFAPRKKRSLSLIRLHPLAFASAALLVFALIFWWAHIQHKEVESEIITGSNSDMYMYHLPVREFAFDRLREGSIPLWNPYTHCGMPFLATYQAALFYPLNFPHWFLPGDSALSLIYLLHIFLAGLFMYLWMRELDIEPAAATFAGVAYMLCAFVSCQLVWCHIILGQTWIPAIFLLVHRTFRKQGLAEIALLGAAVSCQFLTGYMQGLVYTMYGVFAYLLFLTLAKMAKSDGGFSHLLRPLGMTLMGLVAVPALLTAFQWIPTYQLSKLSARPPGGLAREAILLGNTLDPRKFFEVLSDPGSYSWANYTIYPGMLALLFAAFAYARKERRSETVFFSALGLLMALLALGSHFPLFDLYRYIPTGDWFRLPVRLLALTAFAIATLAGIGCSCLLEKVVEDSNAKSGGNGVFAIFIALAALLILVLPKTGGIYILVFLIGTLLGMRSKSASIVGVLAILLLALDLMLYVSNPATFPWITRDVFPDLKEEKEFLREHVGLDRVHIFRRKHNWTNFLLNANFGMIEGIRETSGYESLSLQRYAEFCAFLETGGEPSYLIPFVGWRRWDSGNAHSRMLNLLGARYIIEDVGRDLYEEQKPPKKMPSGFKLKKVFSGTLNIYENPAALPRAFFSNKVEVMGERRDMLERLADRAFDYRKTILLEDEPEPAHVPDEASDKSVAPEVIVEPEGEAKIDIIATVPAAGFVFLNDVHMPGWRARVDGTETKIYRANYLFMAIPVDAGKHSIEVEYRPIGFRAGVWISAISALLLVLGFALEIARTRTKKLAPWERDAGGSKQPLRSKKAKSTLPPSKPPAKR
jgi:hypothetical protein